MPAANQYTWEHKELLEMMIKQQGIHEGKWMILINYALSPINMGPNEDEVSPGMFIGVSKIGIQRAESNSPPALVVDAAEVNPRPTD